MKYLAMIIISLLLFTGCNANNYDSPDDVLSHVIKESFEIPFNRYKNITALSGDLLKRMERRYEKYEPFLTKDLKKIYKSEETYWKFITEMIDHQFSLIIQSISITEVLNEEKIVVFDYEVLLYIDFEDNRETVEVIQTGSATLKKNGSVWRVDQFVYENNIMDRILFDE